MKVTPPQRLTNEKGTESKCNHRTNRANAQPVLGQRVKWRGSRSIAVIDDHYYDDLRHDKSPLLLLLLLLLLLPRCACD